MNFDGLGLNNKVPINMSTETDPNIVWKMALIILYCMYILYVGRAIIITCWNCFLHTCLKPCGVDPCGAGGAIASPDHGRPRAGWNDFYPRVAKPRVTPIFSIRAPSRGSRLCQPNNTGTPGNSNLPTAPRNRDENELNRFFIVIEDVKKIQKQNRYILQKLEIESKKHYEEIRNQTKQLNLLKNLVLDLKNSQNSKQKAEKVESPIQLYSISNQLEWTPCTGNCVICLDKPLTHAVRPCGHFIACADCAEKFKLLRSCPCLGMYFFVK